MDADAFLFFVGYGVEETYALNETTVAAGLFVGCNDVEERTFFRAATGSTDNYHYWDSLGKLGIWKNRAF